MNKQLTAQQAEALSLGRYWGSANRALLTKHSEGGSTLQLQWNDGATVTTFYEFHEEALSTLARLGFSAGEPLRMAA